MKIGQLMKSVHQATGLRSRELQGATLLTASRLAFSNGEWHKGKTLAWLATKRQAIKRVIYNGKFAAHRGQNTI